MKIVIGGSYHNPNWQEVKRVREKLQRAGHEILMPIYDEPIDINEDFIRFPGADHGYNGKYHELGEIIRCQF